MVAKRIDRILQRVTEAGQVEVNQLAKELSVSQVTIRKDLTTLEEKGLLQRQHGVAIINDPTDLRARLAQNYETKRQIALLAAESVKNQSTIMIESGSTCALLAEVLGQQGKRVTIITISSFIADYVSDYPNIDVILLGGNYQAAAQVVVGPLTKAMLSQFQVTQCFVGTDGYSPKAGFFGNDLMRSEIVQTMAQHADHVTILTDSQKFKRTSLVHQLSVDEVDAVVTDDGITPEVKQQLADQHVTVEIAKAK
ncbi:DeoR/GlpR family DNA-binding transcription regulator [Lacticaseibacillus porcinae]|uniref:DeoR/GlpR family DNA-binding transcription regulator n=1 Tax=Lacticaseibacillus porcinae TaxID=1123687 RepID=UPI000F79E44F|nr:DeoR/GlpR family DNA-binding transcription regulator [Lacticaseibacillus porcinae]